LGGAMGAISGSCAWAHSAEVPSKRHAPNHDDSLAITLLNAPSKLPPQNGPSGRSGGPVWIHVNCGLDVRVGRKRCLETGGSWLR